MWLDYPSLSYTRGLTINSSSSTETSYFNEILRQVGIYFMMEEKKIFVEKSGENV